MCLCIYSLLTDKVILAIRMVVYTMTTSISLVKWMNEMNERERKKQNETKRNAKYSRLKNMALIIVRETFGMCKRCGEFANACAHNIYGLHSRDTNKSIFDPHIRNQTCMEHTQRTRPRHMPTNDWTTSNEQKKGGDIAVDTRTAPATHELFYVGCIYITKETVWSSVIISFYIWFDK